MRRTASSVMSIPPGMPGPPRSILPPSPMRPPEDTGGAPISRSSRPPVERRVERDIVEGDAERRGDEPCAAGREPSRHCVEARFALNAEIEAQLPVDGPGRDELVLASASGSDPTALRSTPPTRKAHAPRQSGPLIPPGPSSVASTVQPSVRAGDLGGDAGGAADGGGEESEVRKARRRGKPAALRRQIARCIEGDLGPIDGQRVDAHAPGVARRLQIKTRFPGKKRRRNRRIGAQILRGAGKADVECARQRLRTAGKPCLQGAGETLTAQRRESREVRSLRLEVKIHRKRRFPPAVRRTSPVAERLPAANVISLRRSGASRDQSTLVLKDVVVPMASFRSGSVCDMPF